MRVVTLSLLAGCLIFASGCATNYLVEWKAKPHIDYNKGEQKNVPVAGQPAYYALVPLSVPVDIATAPIQLCVLLAWPAARTHRPASVTATNTPSTSTNHP